MTDLAPTTANRTLPRRQPNTSYRQREYLTEKEVERLIEAARKRGRNSPRDSAAILLAYRHGLRAAELCQLRWSQIDLCNGRLHVNRAKGGIESVHPLHGPELRALRPLQDKSPYVFRLRSFPSPFTLTCCATPAATSSPTTGTIRGAWRTTWATGTCNRPRGTRRWLKEGLLNSGKTNPASEVGQTEACQQTVWPSPRPTLGPQVVATSIIDD